MIQETYDKTIRQTRWLLIRYCQLSCHPWQLQLQLRMDRFSYHNSYVMQELAVTTRTVCTMLDFLQLGSCNRVVLLQDWGYYCIEVYYLSSRHELVDPYAAMRTICSPYHNFPFHFRLPWTWHFMSSSVVVSREKNAGRLPYRCTCSMLPVFGGVRVAHLFLLLWTWKFFHVFCVWVFFFLVWSSLSLDYILL